MNFRETWSGGYGMRLMIDGYGFESHKLINIFRTNLLSKILMFCLKKTENKEKRGWRWPIQNQNYLPSLSRQKEKPELVLRMRPQRREAPVGRGDQNDDQDGKKCQEKRHCAKGDEDNERPTRWKNLHKEIFRFADTIYP